MNEETMKKEALWSLIGVTNQWVSEVINEMQDSKGSVLSVLCVIELLGSNLSEHANMLMNGDENVDEAVENMKLGLSFLNSIK